MTPLILSWPSHLTDPTALSAMQRGELLRAVLRLTGTPSCETCGGTGHLVREDSPVRLCPGCGQLGHAVNPRPEAGNVRERLEIRQHPVMHWAEAALLTWGWRAEYEPPRLGSPQSGLKFTRGDDQLRFNLACLTAVHVSRAKAPPSYREQRSFIQWTRLPEVMLMPYFFPLV